MSAKDRKKIVTLMKKICLHAYLATVDGRQPWVRSVSPIVENDLSIWIATFHASRKVRQIKKNPNVCLEFVSQPNGDQCVIVFGAAKIVKKPADKKRVWKIAPYDLSQYFPAGPTDKNYGLLRIAIKKIVWRDRWAKTKIYRP
jgi:general stress protein 26